jgi:hypothetical protein
MPTSVVTGPDGREYEVTHPKGATSQEIIARVTQEVQAQQQQPAPAQEQPGFLDRLPGTPAEAANMIKDAAYQAVNPFARFNPLEGQNPLAIMGEVAAAGNRGIAETADFLGPGTANAALRLAGSDTQLPTFAGMHAMTPGAEGNFMEPGMTREAVRAGGETVIPGLPALAAVPGRNIAKAGGALMEMAGLGSASPAATITRSAAEAAADPGILSSMDDVAARAQNPWTPAPMTQRADAFGWPLSPGDRWQVPMLKQIESAIESMPMPLNPARQITARRNALMNKAASEAIGAPPGKPLIDDTIGDVASDLSDEFSTQLEGQEALAGSEEFVDALLETQATSRNRLFTDPEISTTIDKVFDKLDEGGNLSVPDYQDMSSELKAKVRAAWKGDSPDPYYADSLSEIISAMDDLAIDGMSGDARARLLEARRKWRALKQLEQSGAIHESGDVSGPKLANYLRRTDRQGYSRGGNKTDMYEAAKLSKAFPGSPDSGTAGRQWLNQLMANPIGALTTAAATPVIGTAAQAYYGSSRALPAMMQAMQSPQKSGAMALGGRAGGLLFEDED